MKKGKTLSSIIKFLFFISVSSLCIGWFYHYIPISQIKKVDQRLFSLIGNIGFSITSILFIYFCFFYRSIYDSPFISPLVALICRVLIKLAGWTIAGEKPTIPKYVLIAAPHTSNWDFAVTFAVAFRLNVRIHWMGKHTIFKGPFGFFVRWVGGIPVNRKASQNLVEQTIEKFNKSETLAVIIPPEGTRSKVARWKTGFYHIANGANVPVVLAYVDFGRKQGGLGPTINLTGDLDADLARMHEFYAPMRGKFDQFSLPTK